MSRNLKHSGSPEHTICILLSRIAWGESGVLCSALFLLNVCFFIYEPQVFLYKLRNQKVSGCDPLPNTNMLITALWFVLSKKNKKKNEVMMVTFWSFLSVWIPLSLSLTNSLKFPAFIVSSCVCPRLVCVSVMRASHHVTAEHSGMFWSRRRTAAMRLSVPFLHRSAPLPQEGHHRCERKMEFASDGRGPDELRAGEAINFTASQNSSPGAGTSSGWLTDA